MELLRRRPAVIKSEKNIQLIRSSVIILILSLGAVIMLMPFYWTLVTSIKTPSETGTFPIIWIPSQITFKWFVQAWNAKFPTYYLNSIIVAVAVVFSNVFTSALAGFIFAKYEFPLKKPLFMIVLATMMVPFIVVLIPAYYIVAVWMGIKDTLWAMIVPALISPFGIFLMRQFASSIPDELLDAARIDGASDFRTFWQIVIPLCVPALSALAIFHFIWIWNDFLWPLLVTDSDKSRTLPVGVAMFALPRWQQINLVVSASVLVLVPMVVVYFIFQRAFVRGIVLTGMKY
jgi:ABC-type glycerol-3-phosphate transport system permease component